jgi:hypothetical protein
VAPGKKAHLAGMKPFLPLLALASIAVPLALAQKPVAEKPAPVADAPQKPATDFIRIEEDEKAARLQTSVTRYQKDGVTLDLIGAVHIADKNYYTALNKLFEKYDALLFEMVGGENLVEGKVPEGGREGGDLQTKVLRGMVDGMSRFLKLSSQMIDVDYSPKNFVHADLTLKQFEKKQKDNGESIFSFALAAAQQAENNGVKQPNPAKLLAALLSGNSDGLKLEMMKTLGQGDDQIAALAGNNVIISDRNAKCLRVLKKQVKRGHKKLGIFYGAAHFPDMEKRLVEKGYQQISQEWMTAWDVPKPQKKPKKEKAPSVEKKAG